MKTLMIAIQWMAFMIAISIAAPIAIADLYNLDAGMTAAFVQRTILILGIGALLQALLGHKLPITEGPAGLWWGVFAIYAGLIGHMYPSEIEVLRALSGGMIVSGILFFILSLFGFVEVLAKLFTPTITFIYLFLLILQLSGSFMKGMLGLSEEQLYIDPVIAGLSVVVVGMTFLLGRVQKKWVQQFSIMFSLLFGWGLFKLFGVAPTIQETKEFFSIPSFFAFGPPIIDSGMIVTSALITMLLLTNMIASIRVVCEAMEKEPNRSMFTRAGVVSGVNQLLGGSFTAIGSVPISGTAGFIKHTGSKAIQPFMLGALFVIMVSFMPKLINIMSALPAAVGYAVTFVIFTKMLGMALSELEKTENREVAYMTAGIAILAGTGIMFLPSGATSQLPIAVASLLNNGLVIGTVIAIITEQSLMHKLRKLK